MTEKHLGNISIIPQNSVLPQYVRCPAGDEARDNKVAITGHAEWRHICPRPGQSLRHVSRVTAITTLYDGDCAAVHCQPIDPFPPPRHSVCAGDTPSSVTRAQVSLSHLIEFIIINTLQLFQQNISDCLTDHITLHWPRAVLRLCTEATQRQLQPVAS